MRHPTSAFSAFNLLTAMLGKSAARGGRTDVEHRSRLRGARPNDGSAAMLRQHHLRVSRSSPIDSQDT